jgi:hypothetical protein
MNAVTLDQSTQLALARLEPAPAPSPNSVFSTGRPLLSPFPLEPPPRCGRALSLLDTGRDIFSTIVRQVLSAEGSLGLRAHVTESETATLGQWASVSLRRPKDENGDALPFLAAVRRFVESEQLQAAREMLESAPLHILTNPQIDGLRRVLAPPIVERVQKRDVDRSIEYAWLRTEGKKHQGRWVALSGSEVLAAATSLRELRAALSTMSLPHPPLLQRVGAANE